MLQPLAIVFIWNQNKKEAEEIISYTKQIFSKSRSDCFSGTMDIPVFYYSGSSTQAPPMVRISAEKVLIYPLIDRDMVICEEWKTYMRCLWELERSVIVPVAMHKTAFFIDQNAEACNCIRAYNYSKYQKENVFIEIAHEIYRHGFNAEKEELEKGSDSALKIFLSHAKDNDCGIKIAEELKAWLDNSPMQEFFDTYSIGRGYRFDEEIEEHIKDSSMILINSDKYTSRYWCQREILSAKRNERPILEVDALKNGMDRSFPYGGNIPVIRIKDADEFSDQEKLRIITAVLVETVQFYYTKKKLEGLGNFGYQRIKICCRPPELLDLEKMVVKNKVQYDAVLYPDPPVYEEEIKYMENMGIKVFTPLIQDRGSLENLRIGISIADPSEEQIKMLGQTEEHLMKLSKTLAGYLVSRGALLVYGGDFRKKGFTEHLVMEAHIWNERLKMNHIHFRDYVAWPIYNRNEEEIKDWEAEYAKIAQIIRTGIPTGVRKLVGERNEIFPDSIENRYILGKCLTEMRKKMLSDCDVCICAGGKSSGYTGKMPGVLEEIVMAAEKGIPLFLLGGFGGITQNVCQLRETGTTKDCLTEEWQIRNNEQYRELLEYYDQAGEKIDYEKAVSLICSADLKNGLTEEENVRLYRTVYVDEAVELVLKGMKRVMQRMSKKLQSAQVRLKS